MVLTMLREAASAKTTPIAAMSHHTIKGRTA